MQPLNATQVHEDITKIVTTWIKKKADDPRGYQHPGTVAFEIVKYIEGLIKHREKTLE